MRTVQKYEIMMRVARQAKVKRVIVKDILQRFLQEMIEDIVRGNRLEFRDFGVFEPVHRPPRVAMNPRNQQRVLVPSKRVVRFKVGRLLKQKLAELHNAATAAATATATQTGQLSPRATRPKVRPHTPR